MIGQGAGKLRIQVNTVPFSGPGLNVDRMHAMSQPPPQPTVSSPPPRLGITDLALGLGVLALAVAPLGLLVRSGVASQTIEPEVVWGGRGLSEGRFQKPRAVAIDADDQLYVVDMTARIQVFDRDGHFLRSWQTPAWENGKPTGLSFNRAGELMVADTHYSRILFYSRDGTLLEERTLGGTFGQQPGEFGLVSDAVEDSQGNLYVGEYGEFDRIQKFDANGEFVFQWGGHGSEPGEFLRPQNLLIDEQDLLWVADACNHRIQVFDARGERPQLAFMWGEAGTEPGQLRYPYDFVFDDEGHIYVAEFGNHRIQKFRRDGTFVAAWGSHGREPGLLNSPWALCRDSQARIHVVDTYNHRIQRVPF